MDAIAALLFGLAVILVAMTGFTAMFGADKLHDGLAKLAAGVTVAAIFLPYAARVLALSLDEVRTHLNAISMERVDSSTIFGLYVLGHLGLAGAWADARFGPPAFIESIERGRGRGRERVTPALERGRDE